jgi:hypothetical protein
MLYILYLKCTRYKVCILQAASAIIGLLSFVSLENSRHFARSSARKKKTKMKKRNLASKESGADFLAHILTSKTPLVYAFARLIECSGVADFLYPMDYSLTFICFDYWCKMGGFTPNSLSRPEMEHRCQKWTHRANQKWSSSRTRNGHIACTQKWTHRVYSEMV